MKRAINSYSVVLLLAVAFASCVGNRYTSRTIELDSTANQQFVEPMRITAGNESNFSPDLSPNRRFVLFSSNKLGNMDIWEKKTKGGNAHQVTFHSADDYNPVISPNGDKLAFVSRRADAGGDIHILDLGFSFARVFGSNEGSMDQVKSKNTIDSDPVWFPDSNKLIFVGRRPGEKVGNLYTVDSDDLRPVQLDLKGEQPNLNKDGTKLVYMNLDGVMVYNFKDDPNLIISPGLPYVGQPRFTEDGSGVLIIRYLDDTNGDNTIDGDDNPTVWLLSQDQTGSVVGTTPLTSAKYASYSPQIRANRLFLSIGSENTLDIFELPKDGHHQGFDREEELATFLRSVDDFNDRVFLIRRSIEKMRQAGNVNGAARLALLEMRAFLTNGKTVETRYARSKIAEYFGDLAAIQVEAESVLVELEIKPWAFPTSQLDLDQSAKLKLEGSLKQVERLLDQARALNNPSLVALLLTLKGQIQASLNDLFPAIGTLTEVGKVAPPGLEIAGRAEILTAMIAEITQGQDEAIDILKGIVKRYVNSFDVSSEASLRAIEIAERSPRPNQSLVSLKDLSSELPILPAMAHKRIAERYYGAKNYAVAKNEFLQVATSYPDSPSAMVQSLKKLLDLVLEGGAFDELDEIYREVESSAQGNTSYLQDVRHEFEKVLLYKAGARMRQGRFDDALMTYKKTLEIDSENLSALRGVVDSTYKLGNLKSLKDNYLTRLDDEGIARQYTRVYLRTYDIDDEEDLSARIAIIFELIEELEVLRSKDSQRVQIHQTLGWLYYQMSYWRGLFQSLEGYGGYVSYKWDILTEFFGYPEPNWLELGVDSFLTAYFLAKPGSVEKAYLAESLAQVYFGLENYDRALEYYTRRLSTINKIPSQQLKLEALLYENGGYSASRVGEYKLAESLQRRSVELWKAVGDTQRIGRSLDRLGLTLMLAESDTKALQTYEEVRDVNRMLKDRQNEVRANLNIAEIQIRLGNISGAMEALTEVEEGLDEVQQKSFTPRAIVDRFTTTYPIAYEVSSVDGFDKDRILVRFFTLQARAFRRSQKYELAYLALQRKADVVEKVHQSEGGGFVYAEELSNALNNLGELSFRLGRPVEAFRYFQRARDIGSLLRPDGQEFLSNTERGNLVNQVIVALQMDLNEEQRKQLVADLNRERAALAKAIQEGKQVPGQDIVELLSLEQRLNPSDTGLATVGTGDLKILEMTTSKPSIEAGVRLAFNANVDLKNPQYSSQVDKNKQLLRKLTASNEGLEWRFYYSQGLRDQAFHALERSIEEGLVVSAQEEIFAIESLFQWYLSRQPAGGASEFFGDYQRVLNLRLRVRLNPFLSDLSVAERDVYLNFMSRVDLGEIQDSLRDDQALVSVMNFSSKSTVVFFLTSKFIDWIEIKSDDQVYEHLKDAVSSLLARAKRQYNRYFIVPEGQLYGLDFERLLAEISPDSDLSFLPTPSFLLPFKANIHLPNNRLAIVSTSNSVSEVDGEKFAGYDVTRVGPKEFGSDPQLQRRTNIVWLKGEGKLNRARTIASYFKSASDNLSERFHGDFPLNEIASLELQNAALLIVDSISYLDNHKEWRQIPWEFMALLALRNTFSQFMVPRKDKQNETNAIEEFLKSYRTMSSGRAMKVSGISDRYRLIGVTTIDGDDLEEACEVIVDERLTDAEDAVDEEEWEDAIENYLLVYKCSIVLQQPTDEILKELAKSYSQIQEYGESAIYQEKVLRQISREENEAYFASEVLSAGIANFRAGNLDSSRKYLDIAESIFERLKNIEKLATIALYRGLVAEKEQMYDDTVKYYEKSRAHFEELDKDDEVAQRLLDIGNIYNLRLSDYLRALDYYSKAAQLYQETGNDSAYIRVEIDRADVLRRVGQVDQAIKILQDVIPEIDNEEDPVGWIRAMQKLANANYFASQFLLARKINDETLDHFDYMDEEYPKLQFKRKLPGILFDAINFKGMILAKLGRRDEAFRQFFAAEKLVNDGSEDSRLALLYNNIGFWKREGGDAESAIQYLEEALRIDRKLKNESNMAYDLRNLAMANIMLGDLNRARSQLIEAKVISERLRLLYNLAYCEFGLAEVELRETNWEKASAAFETALEVSKKGYLQDFVWRAHYGLGVVHFRQEKWDLAAAAFGKSVDNFIYARAGVQSETSMSGITAEAGTKSVFDHYVLALLKTASVKKAWAIHELSRRRQQIDLLGKESIQFNDSAVQALVARERALRSEYLMMELRIAAGNSDVAILQTNLDDIADKRRDVANKIGSSAPALADLVPEKDVDIDELLALVGSDTALIDFRLVQNGLISFVSSGGQVDSLVIDVDEKSLSRAVDEFKTLMEFYSSTRYVSSRIYGMVFRPLEKLIQGKDHLIILPDGILSSLSFAALNIDRQRHLIDEFAIGYLENLRMLQLSADQKVTETARIFALGNPDTKGEFSDLVFAGRESEAISRYFPKAQVLTGVSATERLVKTAKGDVLHIAAHGVFKSDHPMSSFLSLTPSDGDDGKLKVSEIFNQNLDFDLVVLSACDTGVSISGDAVSAFHRAFLAAGTKSIISALWRINDLGAAVVMKRFYRSLREGKTKVEALREAQLIAKRYFTHPAYWSAFRLIGGQS